MLDAQFRSERNSPVGCFAERGLFEHRVLPPDQRRTKRIPHEPEAEKTPHPHHRRPRAVRRHRSGGPDRHPARRLRHPRRCVRRVRAVPHPLPHRRLRRHRRRPARTRSRTRAGRGLPHDRGHLRRVCAGAVPRHRAAHGRRRGRDAVLPGGRAIPKLRRGQVAPVHRGHDGYRARVRERHGGGQAEAGGSLRARPR